MEKVNEQQKRLLQQALDMLEEQALHIEAPMLPAGEELLNRIRDAIYQQAEPTYTFTAVDMATAAAQGFRDGQAAVEPAAAKDETDPVYQFQWREIGEGDWMACRHSWFRFCEASPEHDTRVVEVARPAQTEQQPVAWAAQNVSSGKYGYIWHEDDDVRGWINLQHQSCDSVTWRGPIALYAAPIAQTAPQPEQSGLLEAAKAFADAARKNIYPCPDKPNSLSGKLQALDGAIAAALSAIPSNHAKTGKTDP